MSKNVKNTIFYFFVTLMIISAFLLWYEYSQRKIFLDENKETLNQVNIEIMKTKLKITKSNNDIEIFVNWDKSETWSFELIKE